MTAKPRASRPRRPTLRGFVTAAAIVLLGSAASCVQMPRENPAYAATNVQVRAAMTSMRDDPAPPPRPVLVLSGYRSPPGAASALARDLRRLTGADGDHVAHLSYMWADDITPLGDRVVAFVDERWPNDDPEHTTEVDVVAISMGGIVARWAASDRDDGSRRLNIRTLYTLATPHRGALIAETIRPDRAASQLRAGSEMLVRLDRELESATYEIVPYAVLHDWMVGATRSAPPGEDPIWIPGRVGLSHHLVSREDRIVADIARRLRGETPLGRPSAPPRD